MSAGPPWGGHGPVGAGVGAGAGAARLSTGELDGLRALVHRRTGIALGRDKAYLFDSRLAGLARARGEPEPAAVVAAALRGDAAAGAAVAEALATHETLFFRDRQPFDRLVEVALPALLARRAPGARLRLWSAACSSGQEAYSLGMLIAEGAAGLAPAATEVVGTDFAEGVLARARAGRYSQFEVQRGLSVHRLLRHFEAVPQEGGAQGGHVSAWRVIGPARLACRFARHNLLDDPAPLGRFDVVFLRNALLYFDPPTRRAVLERVAGAMAPDGVLVLGAAEALGGVTDRFAPHRGAAGLHVPAHSPDAAPRRAFAPAARAV